MENNSDNTVPPLRRQNAFRLIPSENKMELSDGDLDRWYSYIYDTGVPTAELLKIIEELKEEQSPSVTQNKKNNNK